MLELLIALATLSAPVQDSEEAAPGRVPLSVDADEARTRITRAVAWLEREQRDDGAWGHAAMDSVQFTGFSVETYYAFQLAANGVAFVALSSVDPTPEVEAMLSRSFEWLTTTRVPKRGSDWDVDCSWSALYGFQAMVAAWQDPRFADEKLRERARTRGLEFYELLERNQEPHGGWGYYEGPAVSRRPTWATSFATACVVPSLVRARELGWPVASEVIERATRYLEQCRQPNGAYSYDLRPVPRLAGETIDDVKGSLGRIQVCNWALRRAGAGRATLDSLREGLEAFFRHHKFLDVARMRPIPHEAYYANAAYFYMFGHCYAALAINELPEAERPEWHRKLRGHLAKIQWADGSSLDFPNMSCMQIAGTSFSILALQAGLPGSRVRL
jgi:hypothetical protein